MLSTHCNSHVKSRRKKKILKEQEKSNLTQINITRKEQITYQENVIGKNLTYKMQLLL